MKRDERKLTRMVLSCADPGYFTDSRGCLVTNSDGRRGYIAFLDAMVNEYIIRDGSTGRIVSIYTSLERLVEGGWKAMP